MKRIFFLFVAATAFMAATAQVPNLGSANPGKLITQLVNAIKPSSFTEAFAGQKSSFLDKVSKLTDAPGIGKAISQLAGFIKPGMFKQGFDVAGLMNTANTVKSLSGVGGLLKNFEGGLKPEALTEGWGKQRSGWLSALNLLK